MPGMARQRVATGLGGKLEVWQGDITEDESEAIVNAANSSLMGGGGVDGVIHAVGGEAILAECKEIRRTQYPQGLPVGLAVMTTGGRLKARYVVHTVGPRWGREKSKESELLALAYTNSLRVGEERGLKSMAFPAISTGIYGFPKALAASLVGSVCQKWLEDHVAWERLRLYFFVEEDAQLFEAKSGLKWGN